MNNGAFCSTVRKYGFLIFESSTTSSSDEAHDFDLDIELGYDSDSDDFDSPINSDDSGLSGATGITGRSELFF